MQTYVAGGAANVIVDAFKRENTLRLSIPGDELYPDCGFTMEQPGRTHFRFFVELDNSTEPFASPKARDSWIRKLRFYEALQN